MRGAAKPILYISGDGEAIHQRSVEEHPIINWGFVAYTEEKVLKGELSVNLKAGEPDPETLKWFLDSHPDAYEKCTKDPKDPKEAMEEIRDWIGKVSRGYTPILVFYPTIYDGSVLYYYWMKYLGHPTNGKGPGFQAIDIRSYASGKLNISYTDASKRASLKQYLPSEDEMPHTHTGLDDAREQIFLYFNIRDSDKK